MKFYFTFLASVFIVLNSFSQVSDFIPGNSPLLILTTNNTPDGYTGSPYVEKNFVNGVIMDTDGKTHPAFLRYNTVEDVVEVKLALSEPDTFVLPKLKNISYRMNGYTYVLDSFRTDKGETLEGYFMNYYDGKKVKFYARPMPDITPAEKAKTGYEKDKAAHLNVKTDYYIALNNGPLKNVRLKDKDFKNALPASKEVDKYFKEVKVKSVEDFVKMLEWYDQQNF
ncbi:hypothetical protein FK178_02930 [Antarcticibacterium arcticum]|uniref:Uncharacterized protein n=1 Tax=Antarcticibacterium arcticum TaxID=2585771 RepID=A0A5B8YFL0_9FLAO|nr:hypothetical protein [Antarcticibacterium arcticum]QED36730.1 hypothetical protein FK178_02930 [Antarcticibacterium arcticum]